MKKKWPTIILIVIFFVGLSLLLYPSVSNYYNSFHQSKAIEDYSDVVSNLKDDESEKLWKDAQIYNLKLSEKLNQFKVDNSEKKEYEKLLNVGGYRIMAYLEVPGIKVQLPVYHSTEDEVLQVGVGHIVGTSLPVGGLNTHCVLSGHRGLVSSKLLSDLDKVAIDDIFFVYTLGKKLTYQVDQIRIVEPREVSDIEIIEGGDYCTLVTCTPYGINTHRLLVRGHRISNRDYKNELNVSAEAKQIEPIYVAPFVAVPVLSAIMIYSLVKNKRRRK